MMGWVHSSLVSLASIGIGAVLAGSQAKASSYRYVTIDPPNDSYCAALALNNAGQVAVSCHDYSYVWTAGQFTRINPPAGVDPQSVEPTGIAPWGLVIGTYFGNDTSGNEHGFDFSLLQKKWYDVNIQHFPTAPSGINGAGTVVGTVNFANVATAFRDDYGRYTLLKPPGTRRSMANAINDSGSIVGAADSFGFLYAANRYQLFQVPSATYTIPNAISANGLIGGNTETECNCEQGFKTSAFVYRGGKFTVYDHAGAPFNYIRGINSHGEAVGEYFYFLERFTAAYGFRVSSGQVHAVDPPGSVSTFIDAVNEAGSFVGFYYTVDENLVTVPHAFIAECEPAGSRCGD